MRSDSTPTGRWLAAAAPWTLLVAHCSTSSTPGPAPVLDASTEAGGRDASLEGGAAGASLDAEAGADASLDERPPTPGYDGSFSRDGCAASGTCAPSRPAVLASGQVSPAGIAVDSDWVYWIDLGGYPVDGGDAGERPGAQVMRCPKDGGSPTTLASGTWGGTSKIGVDDAGVYWMLRSSVLGCRLSGCTGAPTVVGSGVGPFYDIAVDATGVYFTDLGASQLLRASGLGAASSPGDGGAPDGGPSSDGGPTILWPVADAGDGGVVFGSPTAIAVDATAVYFVNSSAQAVFAYDKTLGTVRAVASLNGGGPMGQLAVDDTNLYASDIGQGRILVAPKTGRGQVLSILVDNLTLPVGLAADGTSVFYTNTGSSGDAAAMGGAGSVSSCAAAGCSEGQTARPLAGFVNQPLDLAIDSTRVYWTDFGASADPTASDAGRVMIADKP